MALPVHIVHKVNVKTPGLGKGIKILREELLKAGRRIGPYVQGKVRAKQRIDTGQERRRTVYKVTQTSRVPLLVSINNTVVQALVDETGAKWGGKMPPYQIGSKLFSWVQRKGLARSFSGRERKYIASFGRKAARDAGASREEAKAEGRAYLKEAVDTAEKQAERVSFLVARSIARRGLPRPGDPLRKPFEVTRKEERPRIVGMIDAAVARAANRINTEK